MTCKRFRVPPLVLGNMDFAMIISKRCGVFHQDNEVICAVFTSGVNVILACQAGYRR